MFPEEHHHPVTLGFLESSTLCKAILISIPKLREPGLLLLSSFQAPRDNPALRNGLSSAPWAQTAAPGKEQLELCAQAPPLKPYSHIP